MPDTKVSLHAPPPAAAEFTVPTETVPLLSEGLVYPPDSPLHGVESIDIKSMTAHEEDILTSQALLKTNRVIGELLRSCILDKRIDPDKLLVGDRNAILIAIRVTGYGSDYEIGMQCPSCDSQVKHVVDLSKFPIKRIPKEVRPIVPGQNEFEFFLPVSKKRVTFKLFTGEDERDLLQTIQRTRKAGIREELVTTKLKHQILSIGGETDGSKLAKMIQNMPAKDSRELRKFIDQATPDVQLTAPFVCSNCEFEVKEVEVPLGTEFFWPKA